MIAATVLVLYRGGTTRTPGWRLAPAPRRDGARASAALGIDGHRLFGILLVYTTRRSRYLLCYVVDATLWRTRWLMATPAFVRIDQRTVK